MGKNNRVRPCSGATARLRRVFENHCNSNPSDLPSRHRNNLFNSDDGDDGDGFRSAAVSPAAPTRERESLSKPQDVLMKHLEASYHKRKSNRLQALLDFVEALENNVLCESVENITYTLSQRFIKLIVHGSSEEAALASRALGLLAITTGKGAAAHEILEDSIVPLSDALNQRKSRNTKLCAISSLAMVTFAGNDGVGDIQRSMNVLWNFVESKPILCGNQNKDEFEVLAATMSAWSFLLSNISDWSINKNNWQGAMEIFLSWIDTDDRALCLCAWEAFLLISELGVIHRFCRVDSTDLSESKHEKRMCHANYVKKKILNQIQMHLDETSVEGFQKKRLQSIFTYLETQNFSASVPLDFEQYDSSLKISSWAQDIKVDFLKSFLRKGYRSHIQINELFLGIFDSAQKTEENFHLIEKRRLLPRSFLFCKEKTQYLNKCRTSRLEYKNAYFSVGIDNL